MFLILKMENYKYKMPCLHKFPVFASMCLTGFILCVGLCVFFGNVCVRCEFNWLRCAVFLLKAHTTMGCVSESRLGKCLQKKSREDNRMLPNVDQTHCNVLVLLFRPHLPAAPCITLDSL